MNVSQPPIVAIHTYNCTPTQLWKALTDIDEMRQWYFEALPDFKPELGFETSFLLTNEGRNFTHQFKILEVEPEKLIKYTFNFAEYDGDGYVIFKVEADKIGSKLTLTNVVTKPYPENIPEFKRESGVAGWEYFLGQQLKNYIDSK